MPRFNGQNKKRVDARYFLHEQDLPPMAGPAEDSPPMAASQRPEAPAGIDDFDLDLPPMNHGWPVKKCHWMANKHLEEFRRFELWGGERKRLSNEEEYELKGLADEYLRACLEHTDVEMARIAREKAEEEAQLKRRFEMALARKRERENARGRRRLKGIERGLQGALNSIFGGGSRSRRRTKPAALPTRPAARAGPGPAESRAAVTDS